MIKFLWCQLSHFGDNNNCDHITFFRIVFCKISIERNKIKQKKYAKKLHVLFTEVLSILIPVVWSECQKGLGLNLYIEIKKEKKLFECTGCSSYKRILPALSRGIVFYHIQPKMHIFLQIKEVQSNITCSFPNTSSDMIALLFLAQTL